MNNIFQRVLVLAPHTDDGEFGCGATIARLLEEGATILYVAFSSAEKSVPEGLDRNILRREVAAATSVLGLPSNQLQVLDFEVRTFPEVRQLILDKMIELQKEIGPTCVFLPSTNDTHQDHQTISAEGFRAFKKSSILGYELPWNNLSFMTGAFMHVQERHIEKKVQALGCYQSQQGRSYANPEFVRSLSCVRGTQIGVPHAEAFENIRWII